MSFHTPVSSDFLVNPAAYAGESESCPPINREPLGALGGPILEGSAGYYQVKKSYPVHYDDQASRSWHSHESHQINAQTEVWLPWPQFGAFSFLPYDPEVSAVQFSVFC